MPQFGGSSEKCFVCAKTVYLQEKIVVEDKDEKRTFHKLCLKCSHCKNTLSLGNYASMNGVYYCKPHFKQLFATKGNYDEGFGKEKLTSKWAPPATPASSSAGSFVPVEKTGDVERVERESPAAAYAAATAASNASASAGGSGPKPSERKADSPASVPGRFGGAEKCEKCSKTVYATEKIVIEEKEGKKVYHKTCLRCAHCQNLLTLGNYASMQGVTYCKPHFKQLFAAKGNYDEGFGKEKHATKWEATTTTTTPNSFVPVATSDAPRESKQGAVSEVAGRFKSLSTTDKCTACGKSVYLTERTVVEDKEEKKVYHKSCLRCKHCSVVLSLGNYASMGGVMYCKPHFKQLFASKGNYDEGFGKQKHTAKWIEQSGEGDSSPRSDSSPRTTTTTTVTTPRDDEHEHKHVEEAKHVEEHVHEHKHGDEHEHKHGDEHEHKHGDEHEHKHGEEHEHHHEGEHHHHEGEHSHHEGEHHHHEGEHEHHEGEHHHSHEHEGERSSSNEEEADE